MPSLMSSPQDATRQAAQEAFIPTMRELVRTYQAFAACSEAHVRQFDMTPLILAYPVAEIPVVQLSVQ